MERSGEISQRVHKQTESINERAPGLLAIYNGFVTTHPGLFAAYIIWDTIHSHHKMEHSRAYGPFVLKVLPLLAGDIEISHFEITDPVQLKAALEMPVTVTTHIRVQKGRVADFLEAYEGGIAKYIVSDKIHGRFLGYSYEDP